MAIRNSIIRSTPSLLASGAALAFWAGCGTSDQLPAGSAGSPSTSAGAPGNHAGGPATTGSAGSSAAGAAPVGTAGASSGTAGAGAGAGVGGSVANGGSGPAFGGSPASGGSPATGGAPTTGQAGSGTLGGYNPDFKEDAGTACTLPDPKMLAAADHHLPDPFLMSDGTRMSMKSQWACQRAWLKKTVEAFVHGKKPAKPTTVSGTVTTTKVTIHVEEGGKSADFSIPIDLPSGATGPVPAMFQAEGSGVPTSFLKGEGVAAMSYTHADLEGAFGKLYSTSVSPQIKWAWGVSRAIDVMVSERDAGKNKIIDPTALGTTGCSYAGKSAFTVGAFDERIALGIPMESGTGGLGSYRIVGDNDKGPNKGEVPEQLNEACAKWFAPVFCSAKVDSVPADAEFLVAMYAPRGFTTLDNNRIGHLGPVASFASDQAGAEVFKALGILSHIGYHGGNDTDPHDHCSWNTSQQDTARKAIQGFLTKKIAPANFFEPKLKDGSDKPITFDLKKYITWTTPTLQ